VTAPVVVVAALILLLRTVVSFGGNRYCRRGVYFRGITSAGILPAF